MSDVGSNANLHMVGRTHGLDALINRNPADIDAPVGTITMAATVEAIFGAVYLDSGMKSVTQVMRNLGLMPRLVRRPERKVRVSGSVRLPAASTSVVDSYEEHGVALGASEERFVKVMKSSRELEKSLRQLLPIVQLKQHLDETTQSPLRL